MKSIFGYGIIAKAISSKIQAGTWNIYDDAFLKASKDEFNNNLLPSSMFEPLKSELEIISPAISPSNALAKKALHLTSEIDYFYDSLGLSIWVSGTNGKTTTTQMIAHLLNIQAGGNIGVALCNMDLKAKLIVLEMSSFALHYTKKARPEIYVLLPILDDHISWHGSFKEYEKAKLELIFRMNKTASCIVPKKYEEYLSKAQCKKYFYENELDIAKQFNIDINKIKHKAPFLLDALLALACERIITSKLSIEKLNSFVIDKHKCQEIYDKKNRLWVDDSKATNISAALACINSYKDKKIHLIAGGDEKGQDLREFFKYLAKDTKLYLIGKKDFSALAKECSFNAIRCNLKEAVNLIYKDLKEDEIAILSPACASLDEFSSYKQRGELFIQYMQENDNN